MTSSTLFVHVGSPHHGVTRYGMALAAAARGSRPTRAVRLRPPDHLGPLADALAATAPSVVHLQFTDGLFGASPASAAARGRQILRAARPHLTAVTFHDIPASAPTDALQLARVATYREIALAADLVVVCSRHEAACLRRIADVDPHVIPHFVPERPHPPAAPVGGVGVLGHIYPGKGHVTVIEACSNLDPTVGMMALGGPSPGHEGLAAELLRTARRLGVPLHIAGWIDDEALDGHMAQIAVPVVSNSHSSASGSLASWLGAGRRPLAASGPYVEEVASRAPGCLTTYDPGEPGGLACAIEVALADPDATRQEAVPDELRPVAIAERYAELFEAAA